MRKPSPDSGHQLRLSRNSTQPAAIQACLHQGRFHAPGDWIVDCAPLPCRRPCHSWTSTRPPTHTYLTHHAARLLIELGVNSLDIATVRGPSRLLTRSLAAWLYAQTDAHGRPLYSGIRYESRLGPHECWAIFDGTAVELIDQITIDPFSAELRTIASTYGLSIH